MLLIGQSSSLVPLTHLLTSTHLALQWSPSLVPLTCQSPLLVQLPRRSPLLALLTCRSPTLTASTPHPCRSLSLVLFTHQQLSLAPLTCRSSSLTSPITSPHCHHPPPQRSLSLVKLTRQSPLLVTLSCQSLLTIVGTPANCRHPTTTGQKILNLLNMLSSVLKIEPVPNRKPNSEDNTWWTLYKGTLEENFFLASSVMYLLSNYSHNTLNIKVLYVIFT